MSHIPLFRYDDRPEVGELLTWHAYLLKQPQRGTRAGLRRAHSIAEAAHEPGLHGLLRRLEASSGARFRPGLDDPGLLSALAATAATIAHMGAHMGGSLGAQLGAAAKGGSSPTVSEGRFRRLLEADDLTARFSILRRLIPLLGGLNERRANLGQLAAVLCDWTPERRRQLAYDYYRATPEKT